MKRIYVFLLVLMAISTPKAQVLYSISGNGIEKDSYLFATSNLVPISYLNAVPKLFQVYNSCEIIVGEIVINESDAIKQMTHEAFIKEEISKYFTKEEYVIVDSALREELDLSIEDVKNMRPAMVQNMYIMTVKERLFPELKENVSMDAFFQHLAAKQGLKVEGLETIDDQINILFRAQSIERQAKLLVGEIKDASNAFDNYQEIIKNYKNGNVKVIYEMFQNNLSDYRMNEGERFIYLSNRNLSWANRIERKVKENACFIAVDVLHFAGEEGLIQLLKGKGFKVKAVK